MNCALALRMLDAYVDEELDSTTADDVEGHIASCPACAAVHSQRTAMRSALRTSGLRHAAPPGLRRDVLRSIEQPGRAAAAAAALRWWQALALGVSTAVLGVLGGWWIAQPPAMDSLPDVLAARHVASLSPSGPRVDVASSDRHVVRPWFQGRAEFAPMVRDLSGQGFDLLGARLDNVGNREAVAIVYRLHNHIINVFSWRRIGNAASPEREATVRGFNVTSWSDRDMDFAAISDTDNAELRRFAAAYRAP